ncbi:hypothetical protein VTP01DRAFT_2457 [Rhizomucor pusillus]|uniref:uncharacterized protein n=1 Tax=Rhizomucor pusillus TaxID=4840 RepID=UPI003743AD1F
MDLNNQVDLGECVGEEDGQSFQSWVSWFCALRGHEYYCEVSGDFIEDSFNLVGLSSLVPHFDDAFELILDIEREDEDVNKIPDISILQPYAEMLYGLIHQRYIITRMGLHQMFEKYKNGHFGYCPRVFCHGTPLLPCGQHDMPNQSAVRLYCPNCKDIYLPSSRYDRVDGAHFGTTFPHLFTQTYSEHMPKIPRHEIYVPKIYGFRVSELSATGPRMQWLRTLPPSS